MKCEWCDLTIDKGCKAMQKDTEYDGFCPVCTDYTDDEYESDEDPDVWREGDDDYTF